MTASSIAKPVGAAPKVSAETLSLVRSQVKDLLVRSPAYRKLPHDQQMNIAHDMVEVGSYLAEPEGIKGDKLATAAADPRAAGKTRAAQARRDPYDLSLADAGTLPDPAAPPKFVADRKSVV